MSDALRAVAPYRIVGALCALVLGGVSHATAQSGPIAAYGFNDGTGIVAQDASPNGFHGTLNGATWVAGGKFGGALSFNGSSNWVTVADGALLRLTNGMTIEAWVNASNLAGWRTVILKERSSGLSYGLYASGDSAGQPSAWIRRSNDISSLSASTISTNTWIHLAATYNGAALRVYVNGVQTATRSVTGNIASSTSPLKIGGNAIWGEYFSGLIDEVRIYNRALTPAEIQADMATPVGGIAPTTWSITGSITPSSAGSGASVSLTGSSTRTTTADASGGYSFTGLANGTYTVTPSKSGYTFSPPSIGVVIAGAGQSGTNFTGQPIPDIDPPTVVLSTPAANADVSGTIGVTATATDNLAVAGVQFLLDGSPLGAEDLTSPFSVSWNTSASTAGSHTLTAIARDAAGNVAAAPEITVNVVIPTTYSISGTITPAGLGAGTSMALTGAATRTVTADASGNYTFDGLSNGSYVVTPSKSGFVFTPPNRTVAISSAGQANVNFAAETQATTGIRLIQSTGNGSEDGVSNISATFASPNTAGNFIIVTGTAARPAGTLTISDTLGNTFIPAFGPVNDPAEDVNAYLWYVPNARGGANTITLTATSPRPLEIHVSEWTGVDPLSPLNQTSWAMGSGTSSSSGTKPVNAGELIFGYVWVRHSASAGAGFTPLTLINGDLDEYRIQAVDGNAAATFTQGDGRWFAMMATFRPNGGTAPDSTPPLVTVTAPVDGANVAGTIALNATASDNIGVAGVQFKIDGVNLAAEDVTAPYSVNWNSTAVADGLHVVTAVARDAAGNTTTSGPISVTVGNAPAPHLTGQWSAPFEIGIVAVNMQLLHTGKVLMYSGTYESSAIERVWDPITNTSTFVPNPFYNLFCAGQVALPDGRILVVGGYDPPSLGAANANIFDPVSLTWSAVPNMSYRRWYPTATAMPDGRVLVTSGGQTCLTCLADVPEIFDPRTNQFTTLPAARLAIPYYPFVYVLPDGRVLNAGANENAVATTVLDPTTWTWSMVDPVVRDGHSSAMFRPGQIIKSGTASDSGKSGNAAATAFVLDMTQPSPAWRQVPSMAYRRAFHNTTLLPDGTVLVNGGGTTLDGYNVANSVYAAELWSPSTETWQTLASAQVPRLYHSTSLLLPDGRVLTAGSGNDFGAVNQTRAEIFSPPYLFKGSRPTIADAPGVIQYASVFAVQTPEAAQIASVSLIRPGGVTHAFDEDQRFLNLSFTAAGGSLAIQAPANANLAPPGYYMLFLVNTAGVPSVAKFVRLPSPSDDLEPPAPPSALSAFGGIGQASLTWTAAADNTGVAHYNIHRSTAAGVQPTGANKIGQSTGTTFTDLSVTPGTYSYVVTAQDIAGNVSVASNEASADVLPDVTTPIAAITAPADFAQVSGVVTVGAAASDDVGVIGVRFLVDGTPIGSEDLSPPYQVSWISTSVSNDVHTITAIARDGAGNQGIASISVTVSNTQQTAGLVAAYGFNAGSGVQVADSSGLGNVGTLSNATWTATGKYGAALSFNGTSARVNIADAPSLDLTTGMTIEAWVYPTSSTGWRTVVLKERSGGLAYALYAENGAARPSSYLWTTVDRFVNGPSGLTLNTWSHLAVTYDNAVLRLFVNGVQVSSSAVTGSINVSGSALRIGGNTIWGEYFRGMIDEVRIYNRALSAGEIQADMSTPLP